MAAAKISEAEALARRIADPSYRQNPITRSLNALALLACGKPEYLPLVKKEAQWAADFSANSFQTWYYGYVIMLLSEYVMANGDDSVMPGLQRLALEAANGQSIVGSWGHKFAGPDGRLVGDIDFASAAQRAGWISPVPGGVGPMTRATLMLNTAEAAGLTVELPYPPQPIG